MRHPSAVLDLGLARVKMGLVKWLICLSLPRSAMSANVEKGIDISSSFLLFRPIHCPFCHIAWHSFVLYCICQSDSGYCVQRDLFNYAHFWRTVHIGCEVPTFVQLKFILQEPSLLTERLFCTIQWGGKVRCIWKVCSVYHDSWICHPAITTMIIFLPSCLREGGDGRSLRSTFLH